MTVMDMAHLHEKEIKDFRKVFSKVQVSGRYNIPINDLCVLKDFKSHPFNFLASGASITLISVLFPFSPNFPFNSLNLQCYFQ